MPITTVGEFKVPYLQILDENGNLDAALEPKLSNEVLDRMYRVMVTSRTFDAKGTKMQRSGRLLTFITCEGQEAAQVGSALALDKADWIVPAFRENAVMIARGVPLRLIGLYWAGFEKGNSMPKEHNILPIAIPVGTHMLHAVGIAWAAKLKKSKDVAVTYFGDGATSEGDFHEAMNFAGVFKVPCVFICQNNQWAISVPRERQTAAKTIAQKAVAYGFEGVQVDGNDVLAVYKAAKDAVDKARSGGGPTLIECLTYRMGPHSTSDDPLKYEDAKVREEWKKRDPILRFRSYLQKKGVWSEEYEKKVVAEAEEKIEKAMGEVESEPIPEPDEIFKYIYAEMTPALKEQLAELKQILEEKKQSEEA